MFYEMKERPKEMYQIVGKNIVRMLVLWYVSSFWTISKFNAIHIKTHKTVLS